MAAGRIKRLICIVAVGAGIALAAMLPFLRGVNFGLVDCDDYAYVAMHSEVVDGLSWKGLGWAFSFKDEGIFMPLTWFSYMLDHEIASQFRGDEADEGKCVHHVMHAHSILFHGVNTILLCLLLMQLSKGIRPDGAYGLVLVAVLLWAVHPLRCESVVWIASRKDVQSMTGLLLALNGWVKFLQTRTVLWYLLAMVGFILGGLAKPSVMCFPFLAFALDWFILARGRFEKKHIVMALLPYVFPVILSVGLAASSQWMQKAAGFTLDLQDVPMRGLALNAGVSFGLYVFNTLFPFQLAPQCMMRWPDLPRGLMIGLALSSLLGWWIWRLVRVEWNRIKLMFARTDGAGTLEAEPRFVECGTIWYVVAIFPLLGLSAFGYHALADRFTYIPALGASVALLGLSRHFRSRMVLAVSTALLVAFAVLSWKQTGIWENDRTMREQTIRVDGEGNAAAQAYLGIYHYEEDHFSPKAVECFEKAFAANPAAMRRLMFVFVDALALRGEMRRASEILAQMSEWSQNMRDLERKAMGYDDLVELKPMMVYRYARIAYFLRHPTLGKVGDDELDELVRFRPDDPHILYYQGIRALRDGDWTQAKRIAGRLKAVSTGGEYLRYRFFDELCERARNVLRISN